MARGLKTGGGSRKGKPNKITASVKEVFLTAFNLMQENKTTDLVSWAKNNPTEFYKLSSKFIPTELNAEVKNTGIIKVVRE
jgi:UV DNA damage repair endonuclease